MDYIVEQNLMIMCEAVPVLIYLTLFYKKADCCRPKVASDVISGQKVGVIKANIVTKFDDPSSNRLRVI